MQRRLDFGIPVEISMLNLGCGKDRTGLGVDMKDFGQPIMWDVTQGIPLPDNSVGAFYASHFFEHITDRDLVTLFDEIRRVARDGAVLEARQPHIDTKEAHHLDHVSYWSEDKVQGIVNGTNIRGEKQWEILELKREGFELRFKLQINK